MTDPTLIQLLDLIIAQAQRIRQLEALLKEAQTWPTTTSDPESPKPSPTTETNPDLTNGMSSWTKAQKSV